MAKSRKIHRKSKCLACGREVGQSCFRKLLFKRIMFVLRNPRIIIGLFKHLLKQYSNPREQSSLLTIKPRTKLQALKDNIIEHCQQFDENIAYNRWMQTCDSHDDQTKKQLLDHVEALATKPKFTIIICTTPELLTAIPDVVRSVTTQLYANYEISVVGTGFDNQATIEQYFGKIGLLGITNITAANSHNKALVLNQAIQAASGNYIYCIEAPDRLLPKTLAVLALAISELQYPDAIYVDEDKTDENGNRCAPFFKTDWNPDWFYSHDYIRNAIVFKKETCIKLGLFDEKAANDCIYDFTLRLYRLNGKQSIKHVPLVLHSRILEYDNRHKTMDMKQRIAVLTHHFDQLQLKTEIKPYSDKEQFLRIKYTIKTPQPKVTIIIPTKNNVKYLKTCIEKIETTTDYKNYQIVVVDNDSTDVATTDYLKQIAVKKNCTILSYPKPFNFSAINNFAVSQVKSELLCFMNDDTEVMCKEWLTEMVSLAMRPDTGAVGAKLYYPNNTIQHAGVVIGLGGIAGHILRNTPKDSTYRFEDLHLVQNFSAVTAACLLLRKQIFDEVGGFDEVNLQVAYNDVDLCLKVMEKGYNNVFTPFAELYHQEYVSRGGDRSRNNVKRFIAESNYFIEKWKKYIEKDPFYNPNLTIQREDRRLTIVHRG